MSWAGVRLLFDLLLCLEPSADACGEVLHVCVTQFCRGVCGARVGVARRASAVGDYQGVFILWQGGCEISLDISEVKRAWNVAGFEGFRTVDVDDDGFLVGDRLFEFGDADVGEFACEEHDGRCGNGEECCEELFHLDYGLWGLSVLGLQWIRRLIHSQSVVLRGLQFQHHC